MKKVITSLLVFILLFNFISCNLVYASEPDTPSFDRGLGTKNVVIGNNTISEMMESGTVSQKQGSATKTILSVGGASASFVGMITGIIARLVNVLVVQIDVLMGTMTAAEVNTPDDMETNGTEFFFSIDRCVFNRVPLFDVDYFNVPENPDSYTLTDFNYNVGSAEITANDSNVKIKSSIAKIYQFCRVLAIAISLLVLIYIGIRMALSTVASEQAKYKKMLISWIESIVVLFVLLYIMAAIIELGNVLTGMFYDMRCQLINDPANDYGVFENTIREKTLEYVFSFSGLQLTIWSIIYWVLLFQEIKFFWLYIKRFLMVGLLMIVSPLIIITYSIDKAGDGKAQVFSSWMKEFTVNVLIQPLHALIYLIFILTANALAIEAPLVGLALLLSMGTVERMVKVVFDMKGLTTLRGINKFMKKG